MTQTRLFKSTATITGHLTALTTKTIDLIGHVLSLRQTGVKSSINATCKHSVTFIYNANFISTTFFEK